MQCKDVIPPHGHGLMTNNRLIFIMWGRVLFGNDPLYVLKYVPSKGSGEDVRIFNGMRYLKVRSPIYGYSNMIEVLTSVCPKYVGQSPYFTRRVVCIPEEDISRIFSPVEIAEKIISDPQDPVEEKFVDYCEFFREQIGGGVGFGITASLMFGMHTTKSDIDLIIYSQNPQQVQLKIFELIEEGMVCTALRENEKEKRIVENVFQQKVDESFIKWLVEQRRYYGSLRHPEIGVECHLMLLSKQTKVIEHKPCEVRRVCVEGEVVNADETCLSAPEFEIRCGNETFWVVCYHRGGELVKTGDRVSLAGDMMKFSDGSALIALVDWNDDWLRILRTEQSLR